MSAIDIPELRTWINAAGQLALQLFNNTTGYRKADTSWVTEADLRIEQYLVERISARYPEHGIVGEEQTRHALEREFVWALDPIDGTDVFIAGLPTWGISIGILRFGQPYLGMILFPVIADCYWGSADGAFRNSQAIQVAPPHAWESSDWIGVPSNTHRRYHIEFPGKARALGATIGSMCYVARGSAVGALLRSTSIWDLAAGLAILEAAGGGTYHLDGTPFDSAALLASGGSASHLLVGATHHIERLRPLISVRD